MSSIVVCPHCKRKLKIPESMAGKTCRCPNCKSLIPAEDESDAPAPSEAVKTTPAPRSAAVPSRSRPPREEEPEEELELEEEEPVREKRRRKRKPVHKESSTGLIVGLIAGGAVLLLLMLGGGGWLLWHFLRDKVGADAGWQTFTPPNGDCTILMPGVPVTRVQNLLDIQANQYVVERKNGNEAFGIVVFDVPPRVLRSSLLEDLATSFRNAVMDRLGGGQGSNNTPTFLGNIPGLEFQGKLTARKGSLTGRTYLAKVGNVHRIYLLAAVSEASQPNTGDAARFLESFQITASASPPNYAEAVAGGGVPPLPVLNPPQPPILPPNPLRSMPGKRVPLAPRRQP